MVEADLEGLDTAKLVGHLNCWAYLQAAKGERNKKFLGDWAAYVKAKNVPFSADTVIDPMVSAYDSVHLGRSPPPRRLLRVSRGAESLRGPQLRRPSGYTLTMTGENNYVSRGVFIGSVNEKRGFDVLWQSPNAPKPVPFSPYG